jgi:general stress protein YciG
MANRVKLPPEVLDFFKKTGAQGGKARAKNHSKEQLSEWAKRGGRPKGSGKKKPTKKGAR